MKHGFCLLLYFDTSALRVNISYSEFRVLECNSLASDSYVLKEAHMLVGLDLGEDLFNPKPLILTMRTAASKHLVAVYKF